MRKSPLSLRTRSHESLAPILKVIRKYSYLPNPQLLYVSLGTIAGNYLPGEPVWTMLIGGPSSGGSTVLRNVLGYQDRGSDEWVVERPKGMHGLDTVKGEAAFLSASGKKDRDKHSTGGLLRQVDRDGGTGVIVVSDFTPILSLRYDSLNEVLNCLRLVYDGKYERSVGTDGARVLSWHGKVGFLTKCTGAIENHQIMMSELGQRFIQWRFEVTNGAHEARKALEVNNEERKNHELAEVLCGFLDKILPTVDKHNRHLEPYEIGWMELAARFICRNRSVVKFYRDRPTDIEFVPAPENTPRIAKALKSLYLGMCACGIEEHNAMDTLKTVLWSCIPSTRTKTLQCILEVIRENGGKGEVVSFAHDAIEVCARSHYERDGYRMMSDRGLRLQLDALEYLGVLRRTVTGRKQGARTFWTLSKDMGEIVRGLRLV